MRIFLVVALVAGAFADDSSPVEETKYAYHGLYADKCDLDGLYYKDFNSFVMCNSGVGVVQACSPGGTFVCFLISISILQYFIYLFIY